MMMRKKYIFVDQKRGPVERRKQKQSRKSRHFEKKHADYRKS